MLTAEQINEFKRRKRRRWPAAGGGIRAEHGKKTINLRLNFKDHAGLVLVDGKTLGGVTPPPPATVSRRPLTMGS